MGKTAIAAPIYFSLAWTMLITYQTFTKTAVFSLVENLGPFLPMLGEWMLSHVDLVEFIHVLAWVFVLTSMIPGVLLGKKRGVLVQFFCTLMLSLIALSFADFLGLFFGVEAVEQVLSYAVVLTNPVVAVLYLSLPYLLMIGVDLYGRKKDKEGKEEDNAGLMEEAEEVVESETSTQKPKAYLRPFAT